jgi:hypothetical protein
MEREVTREPGFANSDLARHGIPATAEALEPG